MTIRDERSYSIPRISAIRAAVLADWHRVEPFLSTRWKTTMALQTESGVPLTRLVRALHFAADRGLLEVKYESYKGHKFDMQRKPLYRAKGAAAGCTENLPSSEHGKVTSYPVKNRGSRPTSE